MNDKKSPSIVSERSGLGNLAVVWPAGCFADHHRLTRPEIEQIDHCREHKTTNDSSWLERQQRLKSVLEMFDGTLEAAVTGTGPMQ